MNTKLILPFTLFILLSTFSYAQYSVGLGLMGATSGGFNFDTESEKAAPGVQLKFQYRLSDKFAIAPNVGTFLASKEGDLSFSNLEGNIDFQFNVVDNEYNRGYLLFGPTYNRQSFVIPVTINDAITTASGSWNRYGGFIGFGVQQSSNFYQEVIVQYRTKPVGSQLNDFQVMVKLGYLFEWRKSKETLQTKL